MAGIYWFCMTAFRSLVHWLVVYVDNVLGRWPFCQPAPALDQEGIPIPDLMMRAPCRESKRINVMSTWIDHLGTLFQWLFGTCGGPCICYSKLIVTVASTVPSSICIIVTVVYILKLLQDHDIHLGWYCCWNGEIRLGGLVILGIAIPKEICVNGL